jgi:tRNA G10  N-methylase Trm11
MERTYNTLFNIYNSIEEVQAVGRIPANSLIKADCLEAMKYIADKSVDAIICDPPYG